MTKTITTCKAAAYVPLEQLVIHPDNPREITRDALDELKRSIVEKGLYRPILVWKKDALILGGNQCTRALRELIDDGYEIETPDGSVNHVPVVIEDVSDEIAEEILFSDNNHAGDWVEQKLAAALSHAKDAGRNLLNFGFTSARVDEILATALKGVKTEDTTTVEGHDRKLPGVDEDAVPDEPAEVQVKPGELWKLGEHVLMCGDACDGSDMEKLMGVGVHAALCFTSPPYADMRSYGGELNLDPEHLAGFLATAKAKLFAVNLGIARKDNEIVPYWDAYIAKAKAVGMKLLSWNVWSQGLAGSVGKMTAMFPITHEWVLVFGKERVKLTPTVPNKNAGEVILASNRGYDGSTTIERDDLIVRDYREMGTVLDCPPEMGRSDEDGASHPARFPIKLPEAYIEACTAEGDLVLEPFGGSGSTLIACEKTGRKCRVMEIEPRFCQLIIDRWELYSGAKAERLTPVVLKPKRRAK